MPGYHALMKSGKGSRKLLLRLRSENGDTCALCGLEMNFEPISGGLPNSASIDHIVPLREGGGTDPDNVRLTHRMCNTLREVMQLQGKQLTSDKFAQILRQRMARQVKPDKEEQ